MNEEEKEILDTKEEEKQEQDVSQEADVDIAESSLRIEELGKESKDNYDKYLRAIAELENFKKRATKERAELLKYAGESLVIDLLEVLDDFDRALLVDSAKLNSPEEIIQGVRMIRGRFAGVLKKHAVESKEAIGEKFDPLCHEALSMVPTKDHQPGMVIDELRKAYLFKDKLIRTAQVVVSKEIPEEG